MYKCKLCGRKLTSKESIERGYGKTCYRIHMNTQKLQENDEVFDQIETIKKENSFLKMEIKMIKNQLKMIQANGYVVGSGEVPIERIKREERRLEQNPMVNKMAEVMDALREKFEIVEKEMGDIKSILDKPEDYEYEQKEFVSLRELKELKRKREEEELLKSVEVK